MTILCPTILSRAFGISTSTDFSSGSCTIIKTLVEGSVDDIKKVVSSPGFAVAVTQMQHLDLPREVRRSRNRQLIFCLGNSQAEAFATLKNRMNVETAHQIIQDFEHSNTKMNRLADTIEDLKAPLKKMYDEANCFVTCGIYNWKQTFTCCLETTQLSSVGLPGQLRKCSSELPGRDKRHSLGDQAYLPHRNSNLHRTRNIPKCGHLASDCLHHCPTFKERS